jgi:hypothetical protein
MPFSSVGFLKNLRIYTEWLKFQELVEKYSQLTDSNASLLELSSRYSHDNNIVKHETFCHNSLINDFSGCPITEPVQRDP